MEKLLIEAAWSCTTPSLVVGIQDLGGAGLTCALTETAAGGRHAACRSTWSGCRCASRRWSRTRSWPASRRSGCCSIVDAGRSSTRCSPSAEKWGVLATAIGEVTDTGRLSRSTWHGELVVDVPPRHARRRRPGLRPADARAGRPDPAAGRPGRDAAPPGTPTSCARPLLRMVAVAEPVRQDLGHRAVRPVRAGQHRAGPARGRRRDPHRRGAPASASRCPSTATAGTPASTRTPARSWRWPRRTATWPSPAPSRSP